MQLVESQVAAGAQGHGLVLLTTGVGDFRVAFVVEQTVTTIKTVMPPRRSGL